jgi:hypothetical protein
LWFRVHYSDQTARWIKLPVRQESPIALNYQRLLSIAESTNDAAPRLPLKEAEAVEWRLRTGLPYLHPTWETILARRRTGGALQFTPPLHLIYDVPPEQQYREPNDYYKMLVRSYARHVARTALHPTNPQAVVTDVRAYRLSHRIITPYEVSLGVSPLAETLYQPYYLGQFDADGNSLDGLDTPHPDPLLYWYVPIVVAPRAYFEGAQVRLLLNRQPPLGEGELLNGLNIHAEQP